jgi:hypothetical protein
MELRRTSVLKSCFIWPVPKRRVLTAALIPSRRNAAPTRPTVPVRAYVQIIGSSSPRREGLVVLDHTICRNRLWGEVLEEIVGRCVETRWI